ncbi:major capsid family protein [Mesorhizobium sp. M0204]|uniref:major capsid family protein n=1 Tax=unclassified Mesorhizobium TaxID=325217 RepID=UPI00333D2850
MVAYRRSPEVLKFHMPMPFQFLPAWQTKPIKFDVPGIFRLGGVDISRPKSIRYLDRI